MLEVTNRVRERMEPLQYQEEDILKACKSALSPQLSINASAAKHRTCRPEFVVALLETVAEHGSVAQPVVLSRLRVKSDLDLTGFRTEHSVYLPGLEVEGRVCLNQSSWAYLDMSGARARSLIAIGINVRGDLNLSGAIIPDHVNLERARVGGNLDFRKGVFTVDGAAPNEEHPEIAGSTGQDETEHRRKAARRESYKRSEAMSLYGAGIDGSLLFCDTRMDRRIRMTNARVGRDVDLWGVEFQDLGELENGLVCSNCEIGEKLVFTHTRCDDATRIVLDYSRMRILQFGKSQADWPRAGRISLEGTLFEALVFMEPQKAGHALDVFDKDRTIQLLRRNGPAFYRQPWRQAAHTLNEKGYHEEALEILVSMERESGRVEQQQHRDKVCAPDCGILRACRLRVLRVRRVVVRGLWRFADYGYRPEKTLWTLFALLLLNIGLNVLIVCQYQPALVPAVTDVYLLESSDPWQGTPPEYPAFNPVVYALDTLIPPLDLGQARAWQPNWQDTWGKRYAWYLYLGHMFCGLLLIGVLVAGITKRLTINL